MCLAWWHCQFHNLLYQFHSSLCQVWNSKDWEVRVWALPGAPHPKWTSWTSCLLCKIKCELACKFCFAPDVTSWFVHTRLDCKYSALPYVQPTCYRMGWILSSTHLVTLFTNHLYRYLLTKSIINFCNPLIKIQHSFWLRPDKN
jgi:hypothetical protein